MKIFITVGDDGRVGSYTTDEASSHGMMEVDAPEGFDPTASIPSDYVIKDGALVYDPLPEPEPPVDPVKVAQEAMEAANEAKTTADTAAASMNEYMDALLGLNTTDETEATDAE